MANATGACTSGVLARSCERQCFVIIAFAIFLVVRAINSLKRKEAEAPSAPPAPSKEETLLTEIRDALRERAPQDRP